MIKKILIILLILSICTAYANPAESLPLDSLNGFSIKEMTDNILNGHWKWDINHIITKGLEFLFDALKNNISLISLMFIVAVVSSVLINLKTSLDSNVADGSLYAAYIIAAVLGAKGVGTAIEYTVELARQLDVYIKTIIPVVISVAMASGTLATGAVIQPLIISISQIIAFVVTQWLIPALSVTCGMCVVNNMTNKADLTGIIYLIHKAIRWTCGILMTTFVGIMTVQSMISPALDSVAGKVTRYAISNFVPVIGGLISESIGLVAGYSKVLKGAVGGAGIISVAVMCIKPLCEVAAIAILYNLTSAVLRPVCDKRIVGLVANFGQIVSTLLILLIMLMLMFVINICAAVNIGGFGSVIQ